MQTTFAIFRVGDAGEEEVLRLVRGERSIRPDVPPGCKLREATEADLAAAADNPEIKEA